MNSLVDKRFGRGSGMGNGAEAEEVNEESVSELVLAVDSKPSEEKNYSEGEEDIQDDDNVVYLRGDTSRRFLPPILYEDTNDFKEYKDLGSLEVKLMSAVGQAMTIHEDIKEIPSNIQLEEKYDHGRSAHHITYQMIKSLKGKKEKVN